VSDASLSLLPDFVSRGQIVSFPVGLVGILVGVEILIGMIAGQFARHANGAVGAVTGIGIDDVGTVSLQNLLALAGDVFGHAEGDGKSLSGTEHGVGDPGVAAGGIEENLAGAELGGAASLGDDVGGGAVLDGSAGVIPLGLTQKCYARKVGGERIQTQHGRVSDAVDQAVAEGFA